MTGFRLCYCVFWQTWAIDQQNISVDKLLSSTKTKLRCFVLGVIAAYVGFIFVSFIL